MSKVLRGIDVSYHQGDINWDKVKASGKVDFVILRAGYGKLVSQKDKKFEEYYSECKKRNIPVGCYWYSYAKTATEAKQEAMTCYECIKGKTFEYPVFFDYEDKCQRTKAIASAVIPAFIDTLASKGYYVGLYSYYSLFKEVVPDNFENKYDIWLAHYSSTTSYRGYNIWQYSDKGSVDGIRGNVDLNTCYKTDYPATIKRLGKNGFKKLTVNENVTSSKVSKSPSNNFKAGDIVTLKAVKVYSNATTSIVSSVKMGSYCIYSDEVNNGRIRITNSKANVGKTPSGKYVTGWVNVSDLIQYKTGSKITLNKVKLYNNSTVDSHSKLITGTYYIYDVNATNGRIRITNSPDNVGKTPSGKYVTGWINFSDL